MHVSANIIRFPTSAPAMVDRRVEEQHEADNVVAFPPMEQAPVFDADSQERGQIFAAHRILSRISDQLDSVGTL